MYAVENAPYPDAVLSVWYVIVCIVERVLPEVDECVDVCCTSIEATTASQLQQQH
jgi:hypothetical protein